MYLVVAATEMELGPVRSALASSGDGVRFLVCGVGPVEATLGLTRFLAHTPDSFEAVIHCGAAGAYPGSGPGLLDLCLARTEILAELGICSGTTIADFEGGAITVPRTFPLDPGLLLFAEKEFSRQGVSYFSGTFVTVNGVSGTCERGNYLRDRFQAMCENMEGAAVARVCADFDLPCVEVRWVSNMVEDRDPQRWRLAEAGARGGKVVARLVMELIRRSQGDEDGQ